jgi:hypothetical protein
MLGTSLQADLEACCEAQRKSTQSSHRSSALLIWLQRVYGAYDHFPRSSHTWGPGITSHHAGP